MAFGYIDRSGGTPYQQAMTDYGTSYGQFSKMAKSALPKVQEIMSYYSPTGGFGTGQRLEAEKAVKAGVAADQVAAINAGMSSNYIARGGATRAGAILAEQYGNIEDRRVAAEAASFTPYAQMMNSLTQMINARPRPSEYADQPIARTASSPQKSTWDDYFPARASAPAPAPASSYAGGYKGDLADDAWERQYAYNQRYGKGYDTTSVFSGGREIPIGSYLS